MHMALLLSTALTWPHLGAVTVTERVGQSSTPTHMVMHPLLLISALTLCTSMSSTPQSV